MIFTLMFKRVLIPLIGLIGLFIVIVWVINLSIFDEKFNPKITSSYNLAETPKLEDNAFIAILGLLASSDLSSSDQDFINKGVKVAELIQSNSVAKSPNQLTDMDYTSILGPLDRDEKWLSLYQSCTPRSNYGCLAKHRKQIKDDLITDKRLKVMLQRYDQIIAMSQYQQFKHLFHYPIQSVNVLVKLHQIKLAQTYNSASSDEFLNTLSHSLQFWKMMLAEGATMLDKMVAVAGIWSDVQYLSEFIRETQLNEEQLIMLNQLLAPLSKSELDIGEAFYVEQIELVKLINNPSSDKIEYFSGEKYYLLNKLIQPNATANAYFKIVKSLVKLGKLSTEELIKRKNACTQSNPRDVSSCVLLRTNTSSAYALSNLYNIGGKTIFINTSNNYEDYIYRTHDLNNMIRLVNLQLQLKLKSDMPVQSAISQSNLTNLYTGSPMVYDKENNWLGFVCLNKHSKCRIKL